MWVKFVVISQGPDLNDDNNENQHLKVVLMTNNIFDRLSNLHVRALK